jgi:hypothetical protein
LRLDGRFVEIEKEPGNLSPLECGGRIALLSVVRIFAQPRSTHQDGTVPTGNHDGKVIHTQSLHQSCEPPEQRNVVIGMSVRLVETRSSLLGECGAVVQVDVVGPGVNVETSGFSTKLSMRFWGMRRVTKSTRAL